MSCEQLIRQAAHELGIEVQDLKTPDESEALHAVTIKRKDGSIAELHIAGISTFETIYNTIKSEMKSAVAADKAKATQEPGAA